VHKKILRKYIAARRINTSAKPGKCLPGYIGIYQTLARQGIILMRKKYLFAFPCLLVYFLCSVPLSAQNVFDNYSPIQSGGKLPDDLLILSSEKYRKEKASLTGKEKRFDRKSKEYFLLESNFRIRELLFKGKILFNDPVGQYINKVADQLLAHDPQLRKKLRFYAVKSASVNAFATNDGMVFINLGLIAQLETESQLAFIMSHEITHYTKQHVINQYVVDQRIEKNKKGYSSLSAEEKLLTINNYSKELETEADLEGTEIFLKSGYSPAQVNNVFSVLQYSYLPFDDISFKKTFFESTNFSLPGDYFLSSTKPIATTEEYNEEKSTHPSIKSRREQVLKKTAPALKTEKKDYLVSQAEFNHSRKIARFELSSLYIASLAYEQAIYNSYLLLQEHPGNLYLQKNIAKALYGLTSYANKEAYDKVHVSYDDIEGNSQQVFHLFEKLTPKELNVLSLKYIWGLKKQYPNDKELAGLSEGLLRSLILKHYQSGEDFLLTAPEAPAELSAKNNAADSTDMNRLSKYAKIDYISAKEKKAEEAYFIRTAFIDNFQDKEFSEKYQAYVREKQAIDEKSRETEKQKRIRLKAEKKQKAREEKVDRKKGVALGIDKLVVINPFYYRIDERKKKSFRFLDSESAQLRLDEKIKSNAGQADLQISLLSQNTFTASDVDKFNDYAFLRSWISERIHHLDASVPMANIEGDRVAQLIQKYGTKYYCWTGVIDSRQKKHNAINTLLYTAIAYPLLPYGIYNAVTPSYHTYYYTLVFNLETGRPAYASIQHIDKKSSPDVLNSMLYDTFYQFKNSRKSAAEK
jgi:beta-barrel assembly-enhancing protease